MFDEQPYDKDEHDLHDACEEVARLKILLSESQAEMRHQIELAKKWAEQADDMEKKERIHVIMVRRLVDRYTELVNSGDAGQWDPEEEQVIIDARTMLKEVGL